MNKSAGSVIGLVTLIVAMAVVMLLVARQWSAVAPTALQVAGTDGPPVIVETHGEDAAGEAVRSGTLPDLDDMQQATDAHADAVQDALEQID